MPFGWFPLLLSISGHRINETQAISSRSLCKGCNLTKFRGLLNGICRKQDGGVFFHDALRAILEARMQSIARQHLEATRYIWTLHAISKPAKLQHTSAHFNHLQPKAQPKKRHPFGTVQSLKIVGKRHTRISNNYWILPALHLVFSKQTSCIINERAAWNCCWPPGAYIHDTSSAPPHLNSPLPNFPPPNLGIIWIINVLTHGGRWPPMFWQTEISGGGASKASCYFVSFPRKTPWASKIHGLAKSMYETPPHLFLNKLLKPNTENVLGRPPTSLGNLLILRKKNHTINAVSEGGGVGNVWKMPCLPPPQCTF